MGNASAFIQARDFLLANRTNYDIAYREFRWPQLTEFNWALDYFDAMAAGNRAPALWVINEDGSEQKLSFAEMSERSSRIANHLRALGVRRGDRVLVMLGNEVPLWDLMLAAIKLGAVVSPATTLLSQADLRDRLDRGHMRHVVAGAAHAEKFANLEGDYTRLVVGADAPGWRRFEDGYAASPEFVPDGPTRVTDPLLLYFTSGTTAKPKLVLHSQQSYPIGHLSTLYWIGVQPGDIGSRDDDGYITYVGRTDDVFKASDYRISPFELESVLIEHPAVAEAAVVPSPDPVRFAVPKAFVVLVTGTEPSRELARDIFPFSRERLSPFKRIRRLEFSDLPKTISGKIRRVDLRKGEQQKQAGAARRIMEFFEEDFDDLASPRQP